MLHVAPMVGAPTCSSLAVLCDVQAELSRKKLGGGIHPPSIQNFIKLSLYSYKFLYYNNLLPESA